MIASLFSVALLATGVVASPTPAPVAAAETEDKRTFNLLCSTGWFNWNSECQKSTSGTSQPPSSSISCPSGWTWDSGNYQCKPKNWAAANDYNRDCTTSGHTWLDSYSFCAQTFSVSQTPDSCESSYQWYWSSGSLCCPKGNYGDEGSIPSGKSCPANFYWTTAWGCIPKDSKYGDKTSCPSGTSWDIYSYCCQKTTPVKSSSSVKPSSSSKPPTPVKTSVSSSSVKTSAPAKTSASSSSSVKTPAPTPSSTDSNDDCSYWSFLWSSVGICVDNNHDTNAKCPDSNKSCPTNYAWSEDYGHCIPDTPNDCDKPKPCSNKNHNWWEDDKYCKPPASTDDNCSSWTFLWSSVGVCVDNNHDTNAKCPDSDKSCPTNYAWSTKYNYCVPDTPNDCDKPKPCTNKGHNWWDEGKYCKPPTSTNNGCPSSSFYWSSTLMCIDKNHDTTAKCPDLTKSCPSNYAWSFQDSQCIPNTVNDCDKPKPCTNKNHIWWELGKYCKPPSGSGQPKRRKIEWVVEN